jgi:hypothetical protein
MATDATPEALAQEAREARFVFNGTVQKLRAATMDDVPIDDRTAIVRVDEVIYAPHVLAHYAGHEITVRVEGTKRLQVGQQATFYTNAWLFGDSIAVRSIDHQPVRKTAAGASRDIGDPARRLARKDLQSRFAEARVVVSGRVTSVRLPSDVAAARSARLAAPALPGRISEHDPDWRIAEIQVDEVHKGTLRKDSVTVRFPSSHDVMWHDAPKFEAGQEGLFMLHNPEQAAGNRALGGPVEDKGEFVVTRSADFQPLSEPGGLRDLLAPAEPSGTTEAPEETRAPSRKRAVKRAPGASRKRAKRR